MGSASNYCNCQQLPLTGYTRPLTEKHPGAFGAFGAGQGPELPGAPGTFAGLWDVRGGAGGAVAKTHFRPPSSLGVCAPQCLSPAGLNRPNSTNSIPHKHIPPNPIWSTNLAIHTSGKALDHIALCTCMTDWKEIPLQVHLSRHPIARALGMLGPWRYACTRDRLDKAVRTPEISNVFDAFSSIGSCFTTIWAPFAIRARWGTFFPGALATATAPTGLGGRWQGRKGDGRGSGTCFLARHDRLSRILLMQLLVGGKSTKLARGQRPCNCNLLSS